MQIKKISGIFAALLALAVLLSGTALAEAGRFGDVLNGGDLELVIEGEAAELPDAVTDIELDGALDGLLADPVALSDASTATSLDSEQSPAVTELVLGVKEKFALDAEAIGSGSKVKFKSSKTAVATVTSKGVIKGVKKGKATIRCTVGGETVAWYKVRVVAAPAKVTLNKTAVTLGVKQTVALTPSVPDGTHASFTWSTKNKSIATVSKAGVITGKKAGKTTVTVKTHNGKTASVTVTVKKAPGKVTLNRTTAALKVKGTLKLKATLPANTYSPITWSSSDKKIAKVSATGRVTAVANGTVTITASTFNGRKAACEVTVTGEADGNVKYRALLVGQENFYGDVCRRNRGDVYHMANMLYYVKGLHGSRYETTEMFDLSGRQLLEAIADTFAEADEDDVSLFFIATHGDVASTGEFAGYLSMVPSGDLLLGELASALKAVPGKVIVLLESCGSGAAVYANNSDSSGSSGRKAAIEACKERIRSFDAAVIKAFSNADTGVRTPLQSNTGEMRVENKFYVLTASDYSELSWGYEMEDADRSFNYFTLWLTQGIGTTGSMPADANNNGQATLNELYRYIQDVGDDFPFITDLDTYYQHVQVYPANSSFVLFCR